MDIRLLIKRKKELAIILFSKNRKIFCPYFNKKIILNSDGLHHLRYSSRRERPEKEQLLKLSLLSFGLNTIRRSGTLQEYRVDNQGKITEYWAFIAICPFKDNIYGKKIKVILKKTGNGNIMFWSIMPLR